MDLPPMKAVVPSTTPGVANVFGVPANLGQNRGELPAFAFEFVIRCEEKGHKHDESPRVSRNRIRIRLFHDSSKARTWWKRCCPSERPDHACLRRHGYPGSSRDATIDRHPRDSDCRRLRPIEKCNRVPGLGKR